MESGKQILVVEDDAVSRKIILKTIAALGYSATGAANADEALKAMAERSYSLVLMDCGLPGMDGVEATRVLRGSGAVHFQDLPVVAVTSQDNRDECLKAGMNDYLAKPVNRRELDEVIRKTLGDKARKKAGKHKVEGLIESDRLREPLIPGTADEASPVDALIDLFIRETPRWIGELRLALLQKQSETLSQIANHLSSSSADLGARKVSTLASQIGEKARRGQLESAEPLLSDLERELAFAIGTLKQNRSIATAQGKLGSSSTSTT